MSQEVIMFEISVSPLFSILYGEPHGCDLRFSISPTLKRNLIIENANVRELISIRKEQFPKPSHEVDKTGGRSMAGKERWTEIVQMETKQAESGRSQSLRESDIHREVISRRTERRDSMKAKKWHTYQDLKARPHPGAVRLLQTELQNTIEHP
jgi:hypothetical protein